MLVNKVTLPGVSNGTSNNSAQRVIPQARPHFVPSFKGTTSRMGFLGTLGLLLAACFGNGDDPTEVQPVPPQTGGTGGNGGTTTIPVGGNGGSTDPIGGTGGAVTPRTVGKAENAMMGPLQSAGIIPADAKYFPEFSFKDLTHDGIIETLIPSPLSTDDAFILDGSGYHLGNGTTTKFTYTFTGNGNTLTRTVNGKVTEQYTLSSQTRTLKDGTTTRRFLDFIAKDGTINHSWSPDLGTGNIHVYSNDNFEVPIYTLTEATAKFGDVSVLVKNLLREAGFEFPKGLEYKTEFGGETFRKIVHDAPKFVGRVIKAEAVRAV